MPIFMTSEYEIKCGLFVEKRSITVLVVLMSPLELVVDAILVKSVIS